MASTVYVWKKYTVNYTYEKTQISSSISTEALSNSNYAFGILNDPVINNGTYNFSSGALYGFQEIYNSHRSTNKLYYAATASGIVVTPSTGPATKTPEYYVYGNSVSRSGSWLSGYKYTITGPLYGITTTASQGDYICDVTSESSTAYPNPSGVQDGYWYVYQGSAELYLVTATIGTPTVEECSVTPSGYLATGTSVTFAATLAAGAEWSGWYDGETLISTDNPYTTTVGTSDMNYIAKANSSIPYWTVSVTLGTGILSASVSPSGLVADGTTVTFTVSSIADHYRFKGWRDGNTWVSTSQTYSVTVTSDLNLKAVGELIYYQLYVNIGSGISSVSGRPSWKVAYGDTVTATATLNTDYRTYSTVVWTVGGVIVGVGLTYSVVMYNTLTVDVYAIPWGTKIEYSDGTPIYEMSDVPNPSWVYSNLSGSIGAGVTFNTKGLMGSDDIHIAPKKLDVKGLVIPKNIHVYRKKGPQHVYARYLINETKLGETHWDGISLSLSNQVVLFKSGSTFSDNKALLMNHYDVTSNKFKFVSSSTTSLSDTFTNFVYACDPNSSGAFTDGTYSFIPSGLNKWPRIGSSSEVITESNPYYSENGIYLICTSSGQSGLFSYYMYYDVYQVSSTLAEYVITNETKPNAELIDGVWNCWVEL